MTDHVARLYALALSLVVFFTTWALVAARPWGHEAEAAAKDPRVVALERRQERLQKESARVQRLVQRRFAAYERRLRERQRAIAAVQASNAAAASAVPVASAPSAPAPPSVSVVSVPPITNTSSS